ncbi:MAG: hypothetical protein HY833_01455 [Candidatus Aenigmarchaeota archaeon]|nr:hypothetical protein [Candidatus Aenigmarchaeota archaeon]
MMKRGRPNVRETIQSNLMSVLTGSQTPMTTSTLTRVISKEVNKQVSWNTVQKYLNELIQTEKIQAIELPHSKIEDRTGLTVYVLKK